MITIEYSQKGDKFVPWGNAILYGRGPIHYLRFSFLVEKVGWYPGRLYRQFRRVMPLTEQFLLLDMHLQAHSEIDFAMNHETMLVPLWWALTTFTLIDSNVTSAHTEEKYGQNMLVMKIKGVETCEMDLEYYLKAIVGNSFRPYR